LWSDFLKSLQTKIPVLRGVTPCRLPSRYQCFGGTLCLQLHGKLQNFATHNPVSAQLNITQIFSLSLPCLDYPEHGNRSVAQDGKPDPDNKRNHRKCPFFSRISKNIFSLSFLFLHCATAPSGPVTPHCRGITTTFRHITLGRTPLDEWSSRRTDFYLTTHNTCYNNLISTHWEMLALYRHMVSPSDRFMT
jgi:hypothetical protein